MLAAGLVFAMLMLVSGLWVAAARAPATALGGAHPEVPIDRAGAPIPATVLVPSPAATRAAVGAAPEAAIPAPAANAVALLAADAGIEAASSSPQATTAALTIADDDPAAIAPARPAARLAIVIDDIGWERGAGERSLALPTAITFAVLPGTPLARELAERAHAQGREVILHQPMAALGDADLGPGALRADASDADLVRIFEANLTELPHLAGFSNHMGSRLTASSAAMNVLMDAARQRGLYFLDSRTTAATVALSSARAHAIPAIRRDVFLDAVRTPEAVEAALEQAVRLAEQRGHAVAIGHPHAQTLEILERKLVRLGLRVQLVPVSALLDTQTDAQGPGARADLRPRSRETVGGAREARGQAPSRAWAASNSSVPS